MPSELQFWCGTVLAVAGMLLAAWRVAFFARAIRVTGEVIEWVDDDVPPACEPTCRRKITSRDPSGSLHQVTPWETFQQGPFAAMPVGVPIGVYFMPEMPSYVVLDEPGAIWLPPIALITVGGFLLGLGRFIGL